jgi:hypothetical protein
MVAEKQKIGFVELVLPPILGGGVPIFPLYF